MAENQDSLLGIHEQLQKLNRAMFDEDGKVELTKIRLSKVEIKTEWHDKEITDIKNDLKSILENTQWLKRAIYNAIIGTLSTGIIGGIIGTLWAIFNK